MQKKRGWNPQNLADSQNFVRHWPLCNELEHVLKVDKPLVIPGISGGLVPAFKAAIISRTFSRFLLGNDFAKNASAVLR
jgi:hypothetical protein